MKHDFSAQYSLILQPDFVQQESVDYLTGMKKGSPKHWKEIGDVVDPFACIQLLSQAIITPYKDYARIGHSKKHGGLLHAFDSKRMNRFFEQQINTFFLPLKLTSIIPDVTLFPRGTWAINFNFKLRKPYLSKDDTNFYVIDNPVKKEWVFKVPYIAPIQWKGALRAAMVKQLVENPKFLYDDKFATRRFYLTLLFGDEKGDESGAMKGLADYLNKARSSASNEYWQKIHRHFSLKDGKTHPHHVGRLYFYPTYFNKIGLEVINPVDRKTGAGTLPIYLESVPCGAEGVFTLLYVPLDCIGEDSVIIEKQSAEDLYLVAEGIKQMLTEYGFGAKTSSGFGLTETVVNDGKVAVNTKMPDIPIQSEIVLKHPDKAFNKYLDNYGTLKESFSQSEGKILSNKEYSMKKPENGGSLSEFKKFKAWYKENAKMWKEHLQSGIAPAKPPVWKFRNLDELADQAKSIIEKLNGTGVSD